MSPLRVNLKKEESSVVFYHCCDSNQICLKMLPELWEIVFDELSGLQLLDVILVCKQFKEVVETSSRLMDKLNLVLRKSQCDESLVSSLRKYKNVIVDGVAVDDNLKAILCSQSKSIENLKISNCTITTSDLQQFLKPICHSVRVFSLCNLKLITNTSVKKLKINFPRLQKLHLMAYDDNTCVDTLEIFRDENIQEFVYMSDCHVDESALESLMRFLASQEKLTSLCLVGEVGGKLMKTKKFADCGSLESLWMDFGNGGNVQQGRNLVQLDNETLQQNFIKFVFNYQTTLKVLNITNLQIDQKLVNSLASFNQLTCLRFSSCTFKPHQSYAINAIVKEISLSDIDGNLYGKEICSFLCSMHAVKLKLSLVAITFDVALTIGYDMRHLIYLSIDKCNLNPFTFANIKELKIIDMERSALLRMIQVNRQIEWLEMSKQHRNEPDICDVINNLNFCKTVIFR